MADALAPPTTSTSLSTPCRKRAWNVVVAEEKDLPAQQLAKIQRIWRNKPELAEEYTSFPAELREARDIWLQNELSLLE